MKRSIKVERLYPLGDYKNIKFIEEIDDIEEEKALNPEFMSKLHKMLMVSCDLNYAHYRHDLIKLDKSGYTVDQMLEALSKTYDALMEELDTIDEEIKE